MSVVIDYAFMSLREKKKTSASGEGMFYDCMGHEEDLSG